MHKTVVLIFCLLISSLGYSQKGKIVINWQSPKSILTPEGEKTVLTFEDARHGQFNFLPELKLEFGDKEYLQKATFYDVKYRDLTEEEIVFLPKDFTIDSLHFSTTVAYQAHKPVFMINLLPFRFNKVSNKYEKVLSFSYSCTFKTVKEKQVKSLSNAREEEEIGSSVLSKGTWYKLEISQTGIYKLDSKFLSSLGISVKDINPKNIRLYGNGGGMLPQANDKARANDLLENSIQVVGEEDGKFHSGDYLLFYGKGPHEWVYDSTRQYFDNIRNLYSEHAYYFLTVSDLPGKRISNVNTMPASGNKITEYDEYAVHEQDLFNLFNSGRYWYGEQFSSTSNSRSVSLSSEGIVPSSPLKIKYNVMALHSSESYFNFNVNGFGLNGATVPQQGGISGYPEARIVETINPINASDIGNRPRIDIRIDYRSTGQGARGALDYISINYKKHLRLFGRETFLRSVASKSFSTADFTIENVPSGGFIWDITTPHESKNLSYRRAGNSVSFTLPTTIINEYVVLAGSDFPAPKYVGQVANQDLHGIKEIPNFVIVTPNEFYAQAKQLANFRQSNDGLKTIVVTTGQIYNEFSSGAQDVSAIRDFMRFLYDQDTDNSLKYLLLFGACSYDYKNRITNNTNFVPVYETRNSVHEINSFSSDDYFGFLDSNEGEWKEDYYSADHLMDIGVGRLPLRSSEEAQNIVNKIINYQGKNYSFGKWRNRVTFIADNGDGNSHATFPEKILEPKVINSHPKSNVSKIYIDGFPLVSTPGGSFSPGAKKELLNTFKSGSLIMNYTGHGGERGLAQEDILNVTDIAQLDNINNLPFFVAATCDFGRYDDPYNIAGGVDLVVHPKGGSIAGLFSTRPVYQTSNEVLNGKYFDNVFKMVDGQYPRLGDVMKGTKNSSVSGISNRNYALLGDPSMMLAYPKESIDITSINNKEFEGTDTLRALQTVSLIGQVSKDNALISDFSGSVFITVFDKKDSLKTLGSEPMSYTLQNSIIYEGIASVTNGKFNVSFIVPKDISYNIGDGKISMYAKGEGLIDAAGYNNKIVVGSTVSDFSPDNEAPKMKLFINDTTFKDGGLTHDHPLLLVQLKDESGINTSTSGIGHQITASLDDSKDLIVLNEFYSSLKDTYKEGAISYPFADLSPGAHKIKVKAWDTHNNSVEGTIHFVVGEKEKLTLEKAYAFPNPFTEKTTFTFGHNKSGENLTLQISIQSITGSVVKTFYKQYKDSPSTISDFVWDGSDESGNTVEQGLYIYQLTLGSGDGTETQLVEKLVYLGQ